MDPEKNRRTILFISQGNAVRSPMAEGLVNELFRDRYRAASAGTDPRDIDPLTVEVMNEIGVDLSSHSPLKAGDVADVPADFVVTLCDRALKVCPLFAHSSIAFHKAFEEPDDFPEEEKERRDRFRGLREEIRGWLEATFG